MAFSVAVASGLVVPLSNASADQISNLQAEAQQIQAKEQALGLKEDALAQQYDEAQGKVKTLEGEVVKAEAALKAAQKRTDSARSALEQDALQAYMDGGQNPASSSGGSAIDGANQSLLRAEYESTLVTNQSNTIDQYKVATLNEQKAKVDLQNQTKQAQAEVRSVAADRKAVAKADAQLVAMESQVKGQLAAAIKAQQEAEARAAAARLQAAREAAARAAAAQQAAAAAQAAQAAQAQQEQQRPQTQTVSSSSSVSPSFHVPSTGSLQARALAAAESVVGDPYVWGAAGPSSFDCSGLVMWAYEQAGFSLPHFSGAQYDDMVHIPMSDLQPGDVVFFANPGEHEAMYAGGGQIVEAPYTGADVRVVPLYSEFQLAGRVG